MTLIEAISIACIDALGRAPVWGEDDCCTFACDAVKAAHGIDLMEPLRGKYLSLIHISEPTRPVCSSRMPSSA